MRKAPTGVGWEVSWTTARSQPSSVFDCVQSWSFPSPSEPPPVYSISQFAEAVTSSRCAMPMRVSLAAPPVGLMLQFCSSIYGRRPSFGRNMSQSAIIFSSLLLAPTLTCKRDRSFDTAASLCISCGYHCQSSRGWAVASCFPLHVPVSVPPPSPSWADNGQVLRGRQQICRVQIGFVAKFSQTKVSLGLWIRCEKIRRFGTKK
jgi:hypothetical protein